MLKPKKRITRKEIKQDKLVTFYFKVNDWIGENSKYVFGGFLTVVIVIGGILIYSSKQRANEEKASVELATAERMFEAGQYRDVIDVLNVLVDNYGGTKSARVGMFFFATAHYNLEEYEFAEENFRKVLSKGTNDPLLQSSAMSGIAACMEQQGKFVDAAKQYVKTAEKYPKEIIASTALYNAARCYMKVKENQIAQNLFERIVTEYPESEEVEKARMQLAVLKQQDPNIEVISSMRNK